MKKHGMEVTVGVFVLIGLICVGYLTVRLGKMELIGDHYYPLQARFSNVSGLRPGSSVEMAGVPIGRVEQIWLDHEDKVAMVSMKVEKSVTILDDAIASIKTSGLIGDKYIAISPGGAGFELAPGDVMIDTESAVDIEGLISKYAFGSVEE